MSAAMPEFSLLLPFYAGDDPELLTRALQSSTTEQTLQPSEVVLVQDGPVGDTLARAAQSFANDAPMPVRLVILETNGGLAAALRAGLEQCSFDTVARMDADDISLPERFARQLPLIAEGFELVGAGMLEYEHDPSVLIGSRIPPQDHEDIVKHVTYHNPFNHPTMVYSKAAVQRAGGYQPFGPTEDYWLVARCIAAGLRMRNVIDPLVLYRVSPSMYGRRGGWSMYSYEMRLQRFLLKNRLTTVPRYAFNLIAKFVFRLAPNSLRRAITRRAFILQNQAMKQQAGSRDS